MTETSPCQGDECRSFLHASDCSVHNGPAYPNGPCDCRGECEADDGEMSREDIRLTFGV